MRYVAGPTLVIAAIVLYAASFVLSESVLARILP